MTITREILEGNIKFLTENKLSAPLVEIYKLALRGLASEGLVECLEDHNTGLAWLQQKDRAIAKYREAVGAE